MKKHNLVPLLIFLVVSLVYSFPILKNISWLGQMDWDQFTFWNAVPRDTILRYGQFPLWNPYVNGGNVLLAHTHSLFLSPSYILVLFFGPVVGVKLKICLYLVFGMFGMYVYSKQLGLTKISSYLSSFVYMFSSSLALHLVAGHGEYIYTAFLPWIFLTYQKSLKDAKYIIGCICLFALMILGGSVDVLFITILLIIFFSFFMMMQMRKVFPLKILGIIFVGALLLSSIKLVPVLEFLEKNPRAIESSEASDISLLSASLLSKEQLIYYENTKWTNSPLIHIPVQKIKFRGIEFEHGFHEYGAYIGWIPLILAGIGCFFLRQYWPLLVMCILSLWISLGGGAFFNLWDLIHKLPLYNSLRVPSRFIIGFIFFVALISGFGFSKIENSFKNKYYRILIGFIVVFVALDLLLVNYSLLKSIFVLKPSEITRNSEFKQRYKSLNIPSDMSGSSMYPVFLSNSRLLSGYEVLAVRQEGVLTISDFNYRGEAYLKDGKGDVQISYFSPNKIIVKVNSLGDAALVLNQNYYSGWKVKRRGETISALSLDGLIATNVTPDIDEVTFYYLPNSFIIGSGLTAVTIIFLLGGFIVLTKKRKYKTKH